MRSDTDQVRQENGLLTALLAAIVFLALGLVSYASAAPAIDSPSGSVLASGIYLGDTKPSPVCSDTVMICGKQVLPIALEVGGSFTVKIEGHYRAQYQCSMVEGQPSWIATSAEGGCDEVPVIWLPAKYDEDDAWNVG